MAGFWSALAESLYCLQEALLTVGFLLSSDLLMWSLVLKYTELGDLSLLWEGLQKYLAR